MLYEGFIPLEVLLMEAAQIHEFHNLHHTRIASRGTLYAAAQRATTPRSRTQAPSTTGGAPGL
jgi:hypothetical protein